MIGTNTNFAQRNRAVSMRGVTLGPRRLPGDIHVPESANAIIVFAHGSGSSRLSPRNLAVARALNQRGMATLLFDLLSPAEEHDRRNVFDIPLLADRLVSAVRWIESESDLLRHPIGLFGASTGAAAALVAAADLGKWIGAVVSRGGRPDLAGQSLQKVAAPTLLIVGGLDTEVIALNEEAFAELKCEKDLRIVPGATHLFPERGALEIVIDLASEWFERHLVSNFGNR
jgi:dienelactone hydrolase